MTFSTLYFANLFLIFVRILAVLMTAPVFNNRSIPTVAKIGFAGLLSLILQPILETGGVGQGMADVPTEVPGFLLALAQEILVGVVIGFVSNLVFVAIGVAANIMSLQVGFRTANLFNPLIDTSSSALEQFYTLMAIAIFFTIDGHHWFLRAIIRTFDMAPIGSFVLDNVTIEQLINLTNEIFVTATRIALPVIGTLLLTDLGLGLIARTVPQIQVFFLGLPLKIGLGLVTLIITLALTIPMIKELFSNMAVNILAITAN